MRVAIIPARGGSRGVPNKNRMSVGGRSLLGHAIYCCRQVVDRVIVSTDCPKIAGLAEVHGAQIVTRPEELAGDDSTSQDALRHALNGIECESVAFVQCTAPMLHQADIAGCLHMLIGYDLVVSCVEFDGIILSRDGVPLNRPIGGSQRRQDHERQFLINGGCWAFRPDYLNQPWMSGKVGIHLARYPHRIEIDTPDDMTLAEAVLAHHLR